MFDKPLLPRIKSDLEKLVVHEDDSEAHKVFISMQHISNVCSELIPSISYIATLRAIRRKEKHLLALIQMRKQSLGLNILDQRE